MNARPYGIKMSEYYHIADRDSRRPFANAVRNACASSQRARRCHIVGSLHSARFTEDRRSTMCGCTLLVAKACAVMRTSGCWRASIFWTDKWTSEQHDHSSACG